jgi:hypothetical protein
MTAIICNRNDEAFLLCGILAVEIVLTLDQFQIFRHSKLANSKNYMGHQCAGCMIHTRNDLHTGTMMLAMVTAGKFSAQNCAFTCAQPSL